MSESVAAAFVTSMTEFAPVPCSAKAPIFDVLAEPPVYLIVPLPPWPMKRFPLPSLLKSEISNVPAAITLLFVCVLVPESTTVPAPLFQNSLPPDRLPLTERMPVLTFTVGFVPFKVRLRPTVFPPTVSVMSSPVSPRSTLLPASV